MEDLKEYLDFWDKLSITEKEIIKNNTSIKIFDKSVHVHKAEDSCLGVLLIKSGLLRVYMLSDEGREITLYRLSKGDTCILAASCILSQITFDVFIDAEEKTEVLQINASAFSKVVKTNIYAECFAYKETTQRFSDVMWSMQQLLFMEFDKRLASFLLDESHRTNSMVIKTTHEQIAKNIGSAREVVTRMLKMFAEDKMVELMRGQIVISDKNKLMKLIN